MVQQGIVSQPLAYAGVRASQPPNIITSATRGPASTDINGFDIGDIWVNTATNQSYQLTSVVAGAATWSEIASGSVGAIFTITGDSGGAEVPSGGNFSLLGTANQIAVTGGTNKETFSLIGPYTPATYTAHGVLIGEGTGSIVATTAGNDGQVLTGAT